MKRKRKEECREIIKKGGNEGKDRKRSKGNGG